MTHTRVTKRDSSDGAKGPVRDLRALLAAPPDPCLVTARSKQRVQAMIDGLDERAIVLNVGAGATYYGLRVISSAHHWKKSTVVYT